MAIKPNPSNVSIQVTGQMSEADAGTLAKIHAWRELIRDAGGVLIKAIIAGIAMYKGGDAAIIVITSYFG